MDNIMERISFRGTWDIQTVPEMAPADLENSRPSLITLLHREQSVSVGSPAGNNILAITI